MEYATCCLVRKLCGIGSAPFLEIARVSGRDDVFLLCQGFKGASLKQLVASGPESGVLRLDLPSTSLLILASMVLQPEDAKDENFILYQTPKNESRLAWVESGRSFVPVETVTQGLTRRRQAKNILFCLDEMDQLVPKDVVEEFLKHNPSKLIGEWLEELQKFNTNLPFDYSEFDLSPEKSFVPAYVSPRMISQLYDRFVRLQKILSDALTPTSFDLTHMEVLSIFEPTLARVYSETFTKTGSTFHSRFEEVDGSFYSKAPSGIYLAPPIEGLFALQDIPYERKSLELILLGKTFSPAAARDYLSEIHLEKEGKIIVGSDITQTLYHIRSKIKRLQAVQSIDFGSISGKEQEKLLLSLNRKEKPVDATLTFNEIFLENAKKMTDIVLEGMLLSCVVKLDLSGTSITYSGLRTISTECTALRELNVSRCKHSKFANVWSFFFSDTPLSFPSLRKLVHRYCQDCTKYVTSNER